MEHENQNPPDVLVKYSVLMPYYDRIGQLHSTLTSYRHHYGGRRDWELVIIQDPKERPERLMSELDTFSDIPAIVVKGAGNGNNPSVLYNQGAEWAKGQVLLLTSPEIFHVSDVFDRLDKAIFPGKYYVCSCVCAVDNGADLKRVGQFGQFKWSPAKWYQHGKHRNALYHFCSALARSDWDRVGGFDPEYARGVGYDDDDFRNSVLAAGIGPVPLDDVLTVHIPHSKPQQGRRGLLNINRRYYEAKWPVAKLVNIGLETRTQG